MLSSNSISLGKSAYVAEYIVAKGRAIGSITLFGQKLQDFSVRIKDSKFRIVTSEKDEAGFKTFLLFNVEETFHGNETLLNKTIECVSEYAESHDLSPADIIRLALTYYTSRSN